MTSNSFRIIGLSGHQHNEKSIYLSIEFTTRGKKLSLGFKWTRSHRSKILFYNCPFFATVVNAFQLRIWLNQTLNLELYHFYQKFAIFRLSSLKRWEQRQPIFFSNNPLRVGNCRLRPWLKKSHKRNWWNAFSKIVKYILRGHFMAFSHLQGSDAKNRNQQNSNEATSENKKLSIRIRLKTLIPAVLKKTEFKRQKIFLGFDVLLIP